MSNEILTKQDGQVLNITINRPDNGNGMTDPMVVELTGIIREAPNASCRYLSLRTPFWNEITVVSDPTIGLICSIAAAVSHSSTCFSRCM